MLKVQRRASFFPNAGRVFSWLAIGLAFSTSLAIAPAHAAVVHWTNANSTNLWSDAANWIGGEPGVGDDAILSGLFPGYPAISLSTGEVASSLQFSQSYILNSGDLTLTTGNITVDADKQGYISSVLAGNAGLTKLGTGKLSMIGEGANTFTGNITLGAGSGTLQFDNDRQLGNVANNILLSGGTLQTSATFLGRNITLSGGNSGINVANNFTSVLGGNLSGSASDTLSKYGQGTLAIHSVNSFAGTIHMTRNSGVLLTREWGTLNSVTNIILEAGTRLENNNQSTSSQVVVNRINDAAIITLRGGTMYHQGMNTGVLQSEVIAGVNAQSGSSMIRANPQTTNVHRWDITGALNRSKGAIVNFSGHKLGDTTSDSSQILINSTGGGPTLDAGNLLGGWAIVTDNNGTDFATYMNTAAFNGVTRLLNNGTITRLNTFVGATATSNVRMTTAATHTIAASQTVNSLAFTVATTTNIDAGQLLTIASGGLLTQSATSTIGGAGQLTGSAGANGELFVHTTSADLNVNVAITNPAFSSLALVKGGGNTLTLGGTANSDYSGGTYVTAGTLTTGTNANQTYLGTGAVVVNNARLNLGARGATSFAGTTSAPTYDVIGVGQLQLANSPTPLNANEIIRVQSGSVLSVQSAASAATLSVGTNLVLEDGVILANTGAGGFVNSIGNLGTTPKYFYGIANNFTDSMTVGAGTPWLGVSADRDGSRVLNSTTITANSDFTLQGVVAPASATPQNAVPGNTNRSLTLGNGTGAGNIVRILTTAPTTANIVGYVLLNNDVAEYGSTANPLTFRVTSGATFQLQTANSLGIAGKTASVIVEAGGVIDPNNVSTVFNGNVTMLPGSRFIANDNGGTTTINGTGVITFQRGSILHISATGNAITGNQLQASNFADGVIVRVEQSSIVGLSTKLPATSILEIFNGDRDFTNQAVPENITVNGGMVTNDSSSRAWNSGNGKLLIGSNGATFAASRNTTLSVNEDFVLQGNTLTIGSAETVDGYSKTGLPNFTDGGTTMVSLGSNGSRATLGSAINVGNNTQLRLNVQNAAPDLAAITLATGSTLRFTQANFTETVGSIAGAGNVTSTDGNVFIATGFNNQNTIFSGGFRTNVDPGATSQMRVNKIGTGVWTLTGTSNATNEWGVSQGETVLTAAGNVAFNRSTVGVSGTLTLDNSGAAANAFNNRLGGTTKDLALHGGTFNLKGNNDVAVTEAIDEVYVNNGGYSTINITPGAGGSTILAANTLLGREHTTILLRGDKLGSAPGAGVATFRATNANLSGTLVANNTTTISQALRPDIVSDSLIGGGTGALSFVTQDNTTNGFRRMVDTESTTTFVGGVTTNNNIRLSNALTLTGTYAATTQIQSLIMDTGSSITNNVSASVSGSQNRLSINNSGAILVRPSTNAVITTPYLQSDNRLFFHTYGNLTINGTLVGNAGFTQSGPGTLNLSAGALKYHSGSVSINGGTINLGADNSKFYAISGGSVGADDVYLSAGTIELNGNSQVWANFRSSNTTPVNNVPGNAGNINNSGALATLNVYSDAMSYAGTISGNINFVRTGNGNLDLTAAQTYVGTTTVRGGSLQLRSQATINNTTGTVNINYGSILLDNLNGLPDANGVYTIDNRMPTNLPVVLRGGTLELRGAGGESSLQTVQSVTMQQGANSLASLAGGAGESVLTVGNLVRASNNGTIMNFRGNNTLGRLSPGGGYNQNSRVILTQINGATPTTAVAGNATLSNGFIGGWAIVDESNFAAYLSGSTLGAGVGAIGSTGQGYPAYISGTSSANYISGNVVDVTADTVLTAGNKTVGAVRISGGATRNLTFTNAGDILNIESGGLLRSKNTNDTNIGTTAIRGVLTAGGTASTGTVELYATQAEGTMTINSVIANNPNGAIVSLVRSLNTNGGTTRLTAFNTYTGATVVNGGTLSLASTTAANGTTNVTVPGDLIINTGTVNFNAASGQGSAGQIKNTSNVTINSGTLTLSTTAADVNRIASLTFNHTGGTGTPTVNVATSTTLVINGNISSTNDVFRYTPIIQAGSTTTSLLDLDGAVRTVSVDGLSPIGLQINPSIINGGMIKTGTGILTLGGAASTFTGGLQINSGIVRVDNIAALSTGTNLVTVGTGSPSTAALVFNTAGTLQAGVSINVNSGTLGMINNDPTIAGNVNFAGNSTIRLEDVSQATNARTLTLSGIVSGLAGSTINLTAIDYGNSNYQLTMRNAANNYAGSIQTNNNTVLRLESTTNVGSVLGSAELRLNGGTVNLRDNGLGSNSTLAYGNNINVLANSTRLSLDRSSGGNTGNTYQLGTLTMANATLDITSGNTYALAFSGAANIGGTGQATINTAATVNLGGSIDGAGRLNTLGTGTINVQTTAAGSRTGDTKIGNTLYRLAASGYQLGSGAVEVTAGATLQIDPTAGSVDMSSVASVMNNNIIHAKSGTAYFGGKFIDSTNFTPIFQPLSTMNERYYRPVHASVADFNGNSGDTFIQFQNANTFLTIVPGGTNTLAIGTPLNFTNTQLLARGGFTGSEEQVGASWLGTITVGGADLPAGIVSFGTSSDDGSSIYVDVNQNSIFEASEMIVNNLGGHGIQDRVGAVNLGAGTYNVAVGFYNGVGTGQAIDARWAAGGTVGTPIPFANQVTFTPGGVFTTGSRIQVDAGAQLTAGGFKAGIVVLGGTASTSSYLQLIAQGSPVQSSTYTLQVTGTNPQAYFDAGLNNIVTTQVLNVATGGNLNLVGGGKLLVNGIGQGAGQVTVSNGTTLGGSGTILAQVEIQNGILSPGNSPGTLTTGALNLRDTATYVWELGLSAYDTVNVNGSLTLDPLLGPTLQVVNLGGNPNAPSFVLITYTGADPTSLPNWTIDYTNAPGWSGGVVSYVNANDSLAGGQVILTGLVGPVPEPSTFALAGLAAIGLGFGAWRRRRSARAAR